MSDVNTLKALLEKSAQAKLLKEGKQEAEVTQQYLDNPVPIPRMDAKHQMTEREWTNLMIIRQSCLSSASRVFCGKGIDGTISDEKIIHLAEQFEKWVVRK